MKLIACLYSLTNTKKKKIAEYMCNQRIGQLKIKVFEAQTKVAPKAESGLLGFLL